MAGRHQDAAKSVEQLVESFDGWQRAYHEGAEILLRCAQSSHLAPRDETSGATAGLPSSETNKSPSATGSASAADDYRTRARELIAQAHTARIRSTATTDRFAWFLLTCSDESFRDPQAAYKLAQGIIQSGIKHRTAWRTMSLHYYRLGEWAKADWALVFAARARGEADATQSRDPVILLLQSMIDWQQGRRAEARQTYDRANTAIANSNASDRAVAALATEAAELLQPTEATPDKDG
jgi:hypothetical protein